MPNSEEKEQIRRLRSELVRTDARVQAMTQLARSLNAVYDLDILLKQAVARVTEIMESDRSTLFLVDRDRKEIWSKVAQGENLEEIRQPMDAGLAGWVVSTGKTLNLTDAYKDDRFNPKVDRQTGYRTKSVLSVALRSKQGDIIGVLQSLNKKSGHFTDNDEMLLEAVASQVSIAIENAQLVNNIMTKNLDLTKAKENLANKVEELQVLYELEKEISAAVDEQQMLHRLLRRAVDLLECEAGSIALVSEDCEELFFASAVGEAEKEIRRIRLPPGKGVAGWVAQSGRSARVNQPSEDDRYYPDVEEKIGFPVRNILAVPMAAGGEKIGALELLNKRDGEFGLNDEMLAFLIAGQAVSAIQVSRHRQQRDRENRLSTIGQMLSGVIHDFRTPMTIISGYVQLMAIEDEERRRKEQSELVLRQFEFINEMTRELLSFARGESNLLLRKIRIDETLKDMEEILRREFEPSRVRVNVRMANPITFRADDNKLRRLILNISRNALQAMPEGGEFDIEVGDDQEGVRFAFSDTGPGISDEIRSRLFEQFFTSGKRGGTGLGLAVVKRIVDEHGGKVWVERSQKGGACFVVWLPKRSET